MQYKQTHVELVEELTSRNEDGEYDELIKKCRSLVFHDVLKPDSVTDPKVDLCLELKRCPELKDILTDVLNCDYDESRNNFGVENLEIELIR